MSACGKFDFAVNIGYQDLTRKSAEVSSPFIQVNGWEVFMNNSEQLWTDERRRSKLAIYLAISYFDMVMSSL